MCYSYPPMKSAKTKRVSSPILREGLARFAKPSLTVGLLLLLLALSFAPVEAFAGGCPPLKVRNPEGHYIVPGVKGDIVYRRVDGKELSLDAYVQKHGRNRPAVVVIHGESWEAGSRIAFVGQFLEMLAWLGQELNLNSIDHEPYVTSLKKDIAFSPRQNLKLDADIPNGRGPFPAVIIVHGGGWEAGDKVTYITPLFEPLASGGFAWLSIDYRLTPQYRHQDQIEDLQTAVHFIRAYKKAFNIDPARIAIIGESASGQMTALLATNGRSVPASGRRRVRLEGVPENYVDVAAAVAFYGVYDFEAMAKELTPRSIPVRLFGIDQLDDEARATLRRYSPLHSVRDNAIPLLLICGTKDGLFAQHKSFIAELEKAGASFDSLSLDGAPHGMENWEGHPEWMNYKTKLIEWLKERLAPHK